MSQSDNDNFQTPDKFYTNRRQYLVTYSKADLKKFPTRKSFCDALVGCFNGSGKIASEYWACCLEEHENTSGYHYHACVKLSGPKRWNPVKKQLLEKYGIVVNFSEQHGNYYSAYKYVCKKDTEVYKSANHPDLQEVGSPVTKTCMAVYKNNCSKKRRLVAQESTTNSETKKCAKPKQPRRLSNLDVSEFLIKNNIRSQEELLAKAFEQKEAGKKDLAQFLLNRSEKSRLDLLSTTWKMQEARAQIERSLIPRMDTIRHAAAQPCVDKCGGQWLQCALEVLRNNKIHHIVFSVAMHELLVHGRSKNRNIFIAGPANCGKTFMLAPLQKIFNTFSNPANDKYAWIEAERAELIFLNDFRWNPDMIAWKELLLLLEGQTVHLPSPKNHYAKDICIEGDTPVVATGKSEIKYTGRYNVTDEVENEMMAVRWKLFKFSHQIPLAEQKEVPPCPTCFSKLTLMGEL